MKRFWKSLNPALKSMIVGSLAAAGSAASDAAINGLVAGEIRSAKQLGITAGISAAVALKAYWMRKPTDHGLVDGKVGKVEK